ncbi:hypothetical protein [Desulfovibrio falkowii]|uniref:hypothetical protein n=1 Tax=Desulfovibrio sp. WGS1351 TaxID=3366814 RepID=UPI00372D6D88
MKSENSDSTEYAHVSAKLSDTGFTYLGLDKKEHGDKPGNLSQDKDDLRHFYRSDILHERAPR